MNFTPVDRRDAGLVREVSNERLQAIVRAALGERTRLLGYRLLNGGHFNTSYRLECEHEAPVVLRLSPEPTAKLWRHERALLQRQCSVQPLLEAAGEAVVPRLLRSDFTHRLLPRDWALFEWRPGQSWESAAPTIDAASSQDLWRQFGWIVRKVHAQRTDRFGYPPPFPACSSYGAWFAAAVEDLAADLSEQRVVVPGLARFRKLLRDERSRFDAITVPRLVHGDLWTRNVLVDRGPSGWRIAALLDAERAFFGDPGAEWIFGFLDLPQAFWAGYGRSFAEQRLDRDALWLRRVYQARGSLFMMLEGVRFGFDAGFAHRQFARFSAALRPEPGLRKDFDAVLQPV